MFFSLLSLINNLYQIKKIEIKTKTSSNHGSLASIEIQTLDQEEKSLRIGGIGSAGLAWIDNSLLVVVV